MSIVLLLVKNMSDDLVPELHDIGKLVDKSIMVKGHTFEHVDWAKYGIDVNTDLPKNRTWEGATKHHRNDLENLNKAIIILWVADSLAATSSRIIPEEKKPGFGSKDYLRVLWHEEIKSETIKDQKGLLDLINFIKMPDDNYFERYEGCLVTVPEEKGAPVNITSLFVHSDLTSKFYHIIQKDGILDNIEEEIKINAEIDRGHLFLACCKIRISQQFIRAKDLNIFETLNKLNEDLEKSEYSKYLLFSTEDTLWFVYPKKQYLDYVLEEYISNGFIIEVASTEFPLMIKRKSGSSEWYFICDLYPFIEKLKRVLLTRLGEFRTEQSKKYKRIKSKYDRVKNIETTEFIIHKELSDIIKPPICELCQLAEAKRKDDGEPDPWEKDEIKEYLCETCYDNRGAPGDERADKVHCMNLFRWSTQEEDVNVAWLRVSLDYDILNDAVEDLFSQYVETEGNNKNKSEEEIKKLKSTLLTELRPLAQLDQFTDDYHKFLDELESGLKGIIFDDQSWDKVLSNFYILKIENLSHVKNILKKYNELIDQHFSKLKVVDRSPIKLSISCSNIKFAFFWHWKFLENPQNDVNVNLVGKGEMHLNLRQLDEILNLDMSQFGVRSLHKLSEVSKVSKKLSKVLLYDKGDWRLYKEYDGLRSLLEGGIDFPNILTYAKMMGDQERVVK